MFPPRVHCISWEGGSERALHASLGSPLGKTTYSFYLEEVAAWRR